MEWRHDRNHLKRCEIRALFGVGVWSNVNDMKYSNFLELLFMRAIVAVSVRILISGCYVASSIDRLWLVKH